MRNGILREAGMYHNNYRCICKRELQIPKKWFEHKNQKYMGRKPGKCYCGAILPGCTVLDGR